MIQGPTVCTPALIMELALRQLQAEKYRCGAFTVPQCLSIFTESPKCLQLLQTGEGSLSPSTQQLRHRLTDGRLTREMTGTKTIDGGCTDLEA